MAERFSVREKAGLLTPKQVNKCKELQCHMLTTVTPILRTVKSSEHSEIASVPACEVKLDLFNVRELLSGIPSYTENTREGERLLNKEAEQIARIVAVNRNSRKDKTVPQGCPERFDKEKQII